MTPVRLFGVVRSRRDPGGRLAAKWGTSPGGFLQAQGPLRSYSFRQARQGAKPS